ncbi:amp dependent CoA ligase [Mucidula mucida]|nr:amp dependent CoA ligase [Mucidula mucida]
MTIFRSTVPLSCEIPSNLTVPQFLFDEYPHCPVQAPSIPCLIDDDTGRLVFMEEIQLRTRRLAASLYHTYRIHPAFAVAIMSPNHVDFGPCIWAAHRVGAVVSTLSPTLTLSELTHSLRITRPVLLIVYHECLHVVEKALPTLDFSLEHLIIIDVPDNTCFSNPYRSLHEVILEGAKLPPARERMLVGSEGAEAVAFLAPSSGTTGLQKAVCITHRNVISMILQEAIFNGVNDVHIPSNESRFWPGDVGGGFLPLYHIYGLVFNLHFMLYAGMTLVVAPKFHFENFLISIQKYQITHLSLVPPQAVLLCKHPSTRNSNLSSVRYCLVAAAPLSASLTEELLAVFPGVQLGQGYGMTETCGAVSMARIPVNIGVLGSGGQLLPGTEAQVLKTDGTLAVAGEEGELLVRGGQIFPGYYRNPAATADVFTNDGWLRTGDQVFFKEDDLFIVDRVKELIKVRGHQVAPAELEGHILEHPCVADTAVIGVESEYSGELPFAFVVLKDKAAQSCRENAKFAGIIKADIQRHVTRSMSKFKWLDGGIEIVDIIPRNASGKILRRVLRQRGQKATSVKDVWIPRSRM